VAVWDRRTGTLLALPLAATLGLGVAASSREPGQAGHDMVGEVWNAVAPADLDRHHPADMGFYDALRVDGALLAPPPADVAAAVEDSTLVVVATIADVSPARVIGDLQTVGIRLDVVEVLHGEVRPEPGGPVVVEYPVGSPATVDSRVAALRGWLPEGATIWFLRWQGVRRPPVSTDPADPRFHSMIHMHAMFAQGQDKVVNPLGEHDTGFRSLPGLQADGERFARLTELAARIRAV